MRGHLLEAPHAQNGAAKLGKIRVRILELDERDSRTSYISRPTKISLPSRWGLARLDGRVTEANRLTNIRQK